MYRDDYYSDLKAVERSSLPFVYDNVSLRSGWIVLIEEDARPRVFCHFDIDARRVGVFRECGLWVWMGRRGLGRWPCCLLFVFVLVFECEIFDGRICIVTNVKAAAKNSFPAIVTFQI